MLEIPDRPGLGIEWDENAVRAHLADRRNHTRGRVWTLSGMRPGPG